MEEIKDLEAGEIRTPPWKAPSEVLNGIIAKDEQCSEPLFCLMTIHIGDIIRNHGVLQKLGGLSYFIMGLPISIRRRIKRQQRGFVSTAQMIFPLKPFSVGMQQPQARHRNITGEVAPFLHRLI